MTLDEGQLAAPDGAARLAADAELAHSGEEGYLAEPKISAEATLEWYQDKAMALPDLGIAISGMSCRLPKADTINEFHEHLRVGMDMVTDDDDTRYQCGLWNLPPRAGRLKDLSKLDHEFFGLTQDQANMTDYQCRILYEVIYESILDAGINPSTLRGTKTGLYLGLHTHEFERAVEEDPKLSGSCYYAQYATHMSRYFDLRGPVATYDTACASGFVGLHCAVEALCKGDIDQAIVCGSNIPITPAGSYIFFQMQMLSPSGYSRFMDSRADGYVKAEAVVSLVLQRKHLALRNYASVMATMTSVDGYKKEGITFPSDVSQESLIRATKKMARVHTNHVQYIEAHGTGTPAGDPQEASAISAVYFPVKIDPSEVTPEQEAEKSSKSKRPHIDDDELRDIGPLLVGSVKTNMGHSEGVSGLCSIAKVAMMLENELIYRSLHFSQPNNQIESLIDGRLKVVQENLKLDSKIVPISCYGFGGANVHAILRSSEQPAIEWTQTKDAAGTRLAPRLVCMFGRGQQHVDSLFDDIMNQQSVHTRNCLSDDYLHLLDCLGSTKIDRLMNHRGYVIVERDGTLSGNRELAREIKPCELRPIDSETQRAVKQTTGRPIHFQECQQRPVHMLFPGLGADYPQMAAGLRDYQPFWSTIERLHEHVKRATGEDLVGAIMETQGDDAAEDKRSLMKRSMVFVAYQVALVNLLKMNAKVKELQMYVGYSLGEVSCAYARGLISEQQAVLMAYEIGNTIDVNTKSCAGKLIALMMDEADANKMLEPFKFTTVMVACVNGPLSVTVAGATKEVDQLIAHMDKHSIWHRVIDANHALHNELVMGTYMKTRLQSALSRHLTDSVPCWSANWAPSMALKPGEDLRSMALVAYLAECICRKIEFLAAVEKLDEDSVVVELGPGLFESQIRMLTTESSSDNQAHQSSEEPQAVDQPEAASVAHKHHYVKMMNQSMTTNEQQVWLLRSLGHLFMAGAQLDLVHLNGRPKSGVRRQTPSVSSLFQWDHSSTLFVPRYPQNFARSSAKMEYPIDTVEERDKFLLDHQVEGRALFPATGYLLLIWRIFSFVQRRIYDAVYAQAENELVPVEFHDVRLMRAVLITGPTSKVLLHYEEATGKFEFKEGGTVVVDGYVRSPSERPNELLYEDVRKRIEAENLEISLNYDDIYKQFRVCGYDYGDQFRCMIGASDDGRRCQIKYNERFICLTDNVLQTVFLAVTKYAPSGGLFLPIRFGYIRFIPSIILGKLNACKKRFDFTEAALDTQKKRDAMIKMMERDKKPGAAEEPEKDEEQDAEGDKKEEEKEPEVDCIFECFCDPITGVVITDGIEMTGIRASPAPRRTDINDVLLESYQFVKDREVPVDDERLTNFEAVNGEYVRVCDSLAVRVAQKLLGAAKTNNNNVDSAKLCSEQHVEAYKSKHLKSLYDPKKHSKTSVQRPCDDQAEPEGDKDTKTDDKKSKEDVYELERNGDRVMLSVYQQLETLASGDLDEAKRIVDNHKVATQTGDLLQLTFAVERLMRPVGEIIVENRCQRKMKLKVLEINHDDAIVCDSLQKMMKLIEPSLALDYSISHPNIEHLKEAKLVKNLDAVSGKLYTMKKADDLNLSLNESKLKDFDVVLFKDPSCYGKLITDVGEAPVLAAIKASAQPGGFILVLTRCKMTLAELTLLYLSQEKDNAKHASLHEFIAETNAQLAKRSHELAESAKTLGLFEVAQKSDPNGCILMLFRTDPQQQQQATDDAAAETAATNSNKQQEKLYLRVGHDSMETIESWLEKLKANFKPAASEEDTEKADEATEEAKPDDTKGADGITGFRDIKDLTEEEKEAASELDLPQPKAEVVTESKLVWLCAVATKQRPINGLVGMMQALRKELGSSNLRCYYDLHTFKHRDEPISIDEIKQTATFKLAEQRDLLWNCIDVEGNPGAYRHLTINDYLSHANYLSDLQDEKYVDTSVAKSDEFGQTGSFVTTANRGDLSSFTWMQCPYKYLSKEEHEARVRVCYSALNFRDIMLATGRLPLDVVPIKMAQSDFMLGLEYSGVEIATGKRVMGLLSGKGLATRLICTPQLAIKVEVPDWISIKDAATIPVVYSTAIMALIFRGKMQRGESILIHAASGGVGQAALHLCSHFGLKIYATVGTIEKRNFLLQEFGHCLDDSRIFNSRDCSFERQLMAATRGKGVDLVLNSLAEDKLQASVRCLSDGGRFLEIGKYDMAVNSQLELALMDTNKTFHGILLDKLFDADDKSAGFENQMEAVIKALQDGLDKRYIVPIRHTVFKRNQIEEAFRYMATGKHIGKVLVEICDPEKAAIGLEPQVRCVPRFQLSPDKAYIITGGLGGFGLELCKWLVEQGAKHIVLTSRTGIRTGYQKLTVTRLNWASRCKSLIVTSQLADTLTRDGCKKLCQLALDMAPARQVGAIFHLAMLLKDTLLENMSCEDFKTVCDPKLKTGEYLDEVSDELNLNLDYFVAFSSVTCGKGNAGQANYAYANSGLERICERRRARGQHGLAIQWGAIGDVGVAFENLGGNDVVVGGTIPQRMPSCQAILGKVLCSPFTTCLSVVPVNRSSDALGAKGDLVGAIFHVLGIKDPSKVSEQATLGELGLDSLMAVEIRQYIEREYDMTLNIQEIRALTIARIREIGESDTKTKKDAKSGAQGDQKKAAKAKAAADKKAKAAAVAAGGPETEEVRTSTGQKSYRVAKSYGQQLGAKTDAGNASSGSKTIDLIALADSKKQKANAKMKLLIQKDQIGSFLPRLRLPKTKFQRLNFNVKPELLLAKGASKSTSFVSLRPIFVVPPIHGTFEQLGGICRRLKRPCVGLNWTRKLGSSTSLEQAVDVYLEALQKSVWSTRLAADEFEVDLIGYSLGATIAYEMMMTMHKRYRANGSLPRAKQLKPGKLILLDGSPKQVEHGAKILVTLGNNQNMSTEAKVDEMLIGFVGVHTRHLEREIDYVGLHETLAKANLENKIILAARKLAQYLNTETGEAMAMGDGLDSDVESDLDEEYEESPGEAGARKQAKASERQIARAMEAFLNRYQLVKGYKCNQILPSSCLLLRADKMFLAGEQQEYAKFNDDLDLSSCVGGRVEVVVLEGNHESFLTGNVDTASAAVARHLGL